MALSRPSSAVPEDHRMPRRKVHFPSDGALAVSREAVLTSAAFLALDHKAVNEAKPVLVSVDGNEAQKGFRLPDGNVVVVAAFDKTAVLPNGSVDSNRATFPMSSPNGKHVYMDPEQAVQAVKHGSFKQALRSAEFNAGYNPVPEPDEHPLDRYYRRLQGN